MRQFIFWSFSFFTLMTLVGCTEYFTNYNSQPATVETKPGETAIGTAVNPSGQEEKVKVTMTGGGEVGLRSMDANDKSKMAHALDVAPGKATSWVNAASGIQYTVTPKRKLVIENNPFCREYDVVAEKGTFSRTITEKACVMSDGNWHTI